MSRADEHGNYHSGYDEGYDDGREAGRAEGAAAERDRIRQLAIEKKATWLSPCDDRSCQATLHTHHHVPFADLLDTPAPATGDTGNNPE